MTAPVETPPSGPETAERDCARCGSAAGPGQEYCLECGARLPGGAPAPRAAFGAWAWSALVTAVVAVLAAGTVVAWQLTAGDEGPTLVVATQEQPPVPEATEPEPTPTEEIPTLEPEPTAPVTETQPPPPPADRIIAWPQGTRGWTVVLASIPTERGRPAATARAKEAADAGLSDVGVLVSSRYSSLHPGYFVVFTGVYDTQRQAQQAAALARERGYESYARRIVP